ncbi:MAG: phosphoribosylanthranilate isomerase [Acidocella sp.]|nr:phosphoribosylanthranilate isomerase [Acidocella sp.]
MGRQVKICGINNGESFDAAVAARADYLGFVFYPPSPRYVTPAQAQNLSARHAGGPLRVGLFVTPQITDIAAVLSAVKLDVLQIYADPGAVASVRATFGLPVWRQLGVAAATDFPDDDEMVEGYVVEAKPPAGASRPGGNATLADWALLAGWRATKFWLLAGGLRPDNVAAALRQTNAPGADVSSGVESAPGEKSVELIGSFTRAVKLIAS